MFRRDRYHRAEWTRQKPPRLMLVDSCICLQRECRVLARQICSRRASQSFPANACRTLGLMSSARTLVQQTWRPPSRRIWLPPFLI